MSRVDPSKKERLDHYLRLLNKSVKIKRYLGGGTGGDVWETTNNTAIKVFHAENGYCNERDTYLRLEEFGLNEKVYGFWVPKLVGHHDQLLIVEIDICMSGHTSSILQK